MPYTENLPTHGRLSSTVSTRKAEVQETSPDVDFTDGLNRGGSNAPAVGICTGVVNPKESDWTEKTQTDTSRRPQNTQHIGGNGLGAGDNTTFTVRVADYEADDTDDQAHFIVATQQAAPGADVGSGVINRSNVTVEIGDRVWGTVPVG